MNPTIPYKTALAVIAVMGMLTNGLVLLGFWHAGRAKMNTSSVYIANHTILEQSTSASTDIIRVIHSPSVILLTFVCEYLPNCS